MTNLISDVSPRKAAIVAGSAFIISFILAIIVGNFILPNFIVPGDTAALANDINANERLFNIAVIMYLIILALDAAIALALYIVLKPANRKLASLTGIFRLLYAAIMVIGVLALAFQFIEVYSYGSIKLIGYLFFTCHIFVLGYLVCKSGYIPRIFGVLLITASFCYVGAFYVNFLVPKVLLLIFMMFMIAGELSLSLWLLLKNAKLPEMISLNPR
ncbi:MAG: DUF4386 domain-containing protein [candidate division WOR-3 bacterium]|nr:MAG: DUF4386 domain-containing protein [candidate division WOR-3 bacterium]